MKSFAFQRRLCAETSANSDSFRFESSSVPVNSYGPTNAYEVRSIDEKQFWPEFDEKHATLDIWKTIH